jgi:hypothetical protein
VKKTHKKSQRSKSKKKKAALGGRVVEIQASGELNRVNEHAAGIDIGGERHYVAVPPGTTEHPVREFGVFTKDLYSIADWLRECGVKTVAMESTGVYWVALYEVLGAWFQGEAGGRAEGEERVRAKVGCARLPVATAAGKLWVVTGSLSPGG